MARLLLKLSLLGLFLATVVAFPQQADVLVDDNGPENATETQRALDNNNLFTSTDEQDPDHRQTGSVRSFYYPFNGFSVFHFGGRRPEYGQEYNEFNRPYNNYPYNNEHYGESEGVERKKLMTDDDEQTTREQTTEASF